jgi:hypothetical protein
MIAAAPIVLEATAEVSDGAGELPDGDVEDSPPDAPLGAYSEFVRGLTRCLTACQYSTHHGPSLSQTRAMRQSDSSSRKSGCFAKLENVGGRFHHGGARRTPLVA